jgi:glutathione S-transferase-like protein
MTITITAFERSPDGGRGLARDTRVRWALEEVGQPYEVRLVSFRAMKEPAHLALHPFGLIPTYEEGDLALFETGSIVFHIAERHACLLPDDADARARATGFRRSIGGLCRQATDRLIEVRPGLEVDFRPAYLSFRSTPARTGPMKQEGLHQRAGPPEQPGATASRQSSYSIEMSWPV